MQLGNKSVLEWRVTYSGHIFSPIGKDMKKMIEITKQLARLAK